MLLTTSSAGAIIHSVPLTKFAVTERYQARPGIFKKNISTQQSTWIEHWNMAAAAVAVVASDDGGSTVALGGGFGPRLKVAAVALGGGCGRRTCNNDIGISIVEAEGY